MQNCIYIAEIKRKCFMTKSLFSAFAGAAAEKTGVDAKSLFQI